MMRILLALLLVPLLFSPAGAVAPYVGGSLAYDVVFPHYNLKSLTQSGWVHDFGCWGAQFDAGLAWPEASVYAGYHAVNSGLYNTEFWREHRWLLGARWHMNGRGAYPVKPTVGAALTYGTSRFMWDLEPRREIRRAVSPGAMIEFGFLVVTRARLDVLLMAQLHRYEPDFPDDGLRYTPDHYVNLMPGWQINLRYRLPELPRP